MSNYFNYVINITFARSDVHGEHVSGLPVMGLRVYGLLAPAKSGVGICTPENNTKATTDAQSVFFIVVAPAYLYSSARCRYVSMVALFRQLSGWPVAFVSGSANLFSVTAIEICTSGGDLNHTKEIIIMMAAPAHSHPQFIWIIAAVRRDCPTIKPVIHHISAVSEREARRTLARDHVCFFAGRIRQEDAA